MPQLQRQDAFNWGNDLYGGAFVPVDHLEEAQVQEDW